MARRTAQFFDRATERRLVEALQRGDEQAFTTIYTTYRKPLIRHAMNFTRSRTRAEDVVQDVCFKVWVDHATVNVHNSLTGYLFRAVRNRVYDLGRRDTHLVMEPLPADEDDVAALGFAQEDTEEDAHCSDFLRIVATVVISLTPQVRKAFLLSWNDGVTYAMMAGRLGLTESTVRQHLIKARDRCWEALIRTGVVDAHQRFRSHHGNRRPPMADGGIPEREKVPQDRQDQQRKSCLDREVPIPVHREPGVAQSDRPESSPDDIRLTLEDLIDRLLTCP